MTIAILFAVFIVLCILSVPIAISIGLATLCAVFYGDVISLSYLTRAMSTSVNSFTLTAIPFFVFAGHIMASSGISSGLFETARVMVGRIKGGIMIVTVVACMMFGAISGSAYATVAAIGLIALPELHKQGLSKGAAAALIAASGGLGIMIPPSNGLVLFGALNNISIAKLFSAEIIPGIVIGLCFSVYCYIYGGKHNIYSEKKFTIKEKLTTIWKVRFSLLMPIIILGGIFLGIFTPTEAAVVAVIYGLIYGFVKKENRLQIKDLPEMMISTIITTATIMFILGVSSGFGKVMALEQLPTKMSAFVISHIASKGMALLALNLLVMFLGTFLDGIAINTILSPILLNIAVQYGVDPIHYGVMFIFCATLGLLTPPLGGNLFVSAQVTETSFEDIVKNIWPWIVAMIVGLLLITFIPMLSTWLPSFIK